jgi:hypothetical protein
MTVSTAHVNPKCAFLADPSRVFGLDEECSGHFHLRDKKLFGQFSVFKSHQSHQILLKFEVNLVLYIAYSESLIYRFASTILLHSELSRFLPNWHHQYYLLLEIWCRG